MGCKTILCCLLLVVTPVFAEEPAMPDPFPICDSDGNCEDDDLPINVQLEQTGPFSVLDSPRRKIAGVLERMAVGIDEFFSNEDLYYESSGTYAKWTVDTLFEEGGNISYDSKFRVRLRLPRTQEKLKLVFETDADKPDDESDQTFQATPQDAVEEPAYYAGLEAEYGEADKWRFRPSIGIRLHDPVDPYIRFRLSRQFDYDSWLFKFTEMPFWFDSTGWGSETSFQLDIDAGQDKLFRSMTTGRWTRVNEYFELSQVFSLIHTISERRAISYNVGAFGIDEPVVHVTDYLVSVNYRQLIHSDYLYMELIPHVRYRRENDFTTEYGFIFRLEMVIKE